MPIYEYTCRGCGMDFEALVRGGVAPNCPSCSGEELERRMSLPRVQGDGSRAKAMRAAKKRDQGQASDHMHDRLHYEHSHDRHGDQ